MNILFITQLYPLDKNAKKTTFALHDFVKEWAKAHQVKVIRPYYHYEDEPPPASEQITIDGVEINILKPIWIPVIKKSLINRKQVLKMINFKPDVVICHKNTAYLPFFFLKRQLNIPFVVGIHTTDILFSKNWLFKRRQLKVFRETDLLIFRSMVLKKYFLAAFKGLNIKRSHIANSGIPKHRIKKEKKIQYSQTKNVIYVGELIARKNADKILTALVDIDCDFKLTIVGEGKIKEQLKSLIKRFNIQDKVVFTGYLQREDVFKEMDKNDYFIMPSKNETFGLVYIEAMARGLVVVGMKNWGIDGIIVDGKNGFLCQNDKQEQITKKIKEVMNLKLQEHQIIVNNSLATIRNLTKEKMVEAYLSAVSELVNADN